MRNVPKLLYIVEAMGGGIFTYIVTLANGLCDKYDITVAYGIRSETPENIEDYFDDRVNLVKVKNFQRAVRFGKDRAATKELKELVKELKPDIVHLHSSKAGAIGRLFLKSSKYKMFYTPHGYSFLMEDIRPIRKRVYYAIEKFCAKDHCITVACGKGEWESSLSLDENAVYISNGVDTKLIDKSTYKSVPKENHQFTVFTVGRMDFQKNPRMFNNIAELLPDVKFVWIGEGELRRQITSKNIETTGWLPRAKALEIAANQDVFVLPSRWEGLPLSLLEAMYMKKPCIVSDVIGNRDIVHDGVTGYICNTPEEFAEKIEEIRNKDNSEIIENAYEEIINHYNDEWLTHRYAELYSE